MKNRHLPDCDHIVRYIKPSEIENGIVNGAEAFCLSPSRPGEKGLSVNWLEVFGLDKGHQLSEVRRLSQLTLRENGRFAELQVGDICSKDINELNILYIVQDPLEANHNFDADPSHALIIGVPQKETEEALKCFDKTSSMEVASFRYGRCEIRELWDDAVSLSLGIDRDSIAC